MESFASPCALQWRSFAMTSGLLAEILDAHGGIKRLGEIRERRCGVVSGGGFFGLKVLVQDSSPRRMTAWLHEERSSVSPYGAADQRTMFTPDRIAIER